MAAVTIEATDLAELIAAAGEWAYELEVHIAPDSRGFGDVESAESQEGQAEDITASIRRANIALTEVFKAS